MKSKLAIAVTLWGWLLFVVWLSFDYAVYQDRWIIHIFQPASSYEIHAFHILIILIPLIYTLLGYLVDERENLLTKVKQSEEKYRELALLDELTGIYNRRGFDFLAEQQLKKANRTKNRMLLLYADVDDVKWINDKFGHQEGDKALMDIAGILKKHIRKSDILARISENGLDGIRVVNGVAARNESVSNGLAPAGSDGNGLAMSVGVATGNLVDDAGLDGVRVQQTTLLLDNVITRSGLRGVFHMGFGDLGYGGNNFDDNAAGSLTCVIGGVCLSVAKNLCAGSTTCP